MSLQLVNCVDFIPDDVTFELQKSNQCVKVDYPELEGAGDLLRLSSGKGALGANSQTEVTFKSEDDYHFQLTLKNKINGIEQKIFNLRIGEDFEVSDDVLTDDAKTVAVEKAKEKFGWTRDEEVYLSEREGDCKNKYHLKGYCKYIKKNAESNCNINPNVRVLCKDACSKHTSICADTRWSYTGFLGQQNWTKNLKIKDNQCNGTKQSPINLNPASAIGGPVTEANTPLKITDDYKDKNLTGEMVNNGHTAQFNPTNAGGFETTFNRGVGDTKYKLSQIHFHWGPSDSEGSEHTVSGQAHPLEMHMVHLNNINGTALVLGFLFNISPDDGPGINQFVNALPKIQKRKSKTKVQSLSLKSFFEAVSTQDFYAYQGSLTTPPCSEIVTWIVFGNKLPVSSAQLEKFRALEDIFEDPMTSNFRNPQRLNNREVFKFRPQPT